MDAYGTTLEVRAVDDVSLHVNENEIYGIAGELSCGKSTLVRAIGGAIKPPLRIVEGSAVFDFGGTRAAMEKPERAELDRIRWRHLSFVVQGSMNTLNPVRRVRHAFVDFAFRHLALPMPEFMQRVRAHLERLRLLPSVLDAYPHELSGGMRQRVTIALATICRPQFIIADEPTTALDVVVQKDVLTLLRSGAAGDARFPLLVTHDLHCPRDALPTGSA